MREVKSIDILELEIKKLNKLIGKLILNSENNMVRNTIKINMYKDRLDKLEKELCNRKEVVYGF